MTAPSLKRWRETGIAPESLPSKPKRAKPRFDVSEAQLERARKRNALRLAGGPVRTAGKAIRAVRRELPSGLCCEICRERISGKKVMVDHCHDSLKIRGFLCTRCNAGLGMFRDSVALLGHAIKYLEKHGSWSTRASVVGLDESEGVRDGLQGAYDCEKNCEGGEDRAGSEARAHDAC